MKEVEERIMCNVQVKSMVDDQLKSAGFDQDLSAAAVVRFSCDFWAASYC